MVKRKVFIGFLLVCVALFSFAAGSQEGQPEVRWITYMTPETDPTSIEVDEEIIRRFESANPGVKVNLEHAEINTILPKLALMIKAGTAPDISLNYAPFSQALVDQGFVAPVNSIWENLGDINENFAGPRDGDLFYDVPLANESVMLYYRKDLFQEAGLAVPGTWDEQLEAAEKLTVDTNGDGNMDRWGIAINGAPPSNWPSFADYVWQNGGRLFDKNNNITLDSDKAIAALEFWGKLAQYAPPGVANTSYHDQSVQFAEGIVAMVKYPGRLMTNIERYNPETGFKIGVTTPPIGDAPEPVLRIAINDMIVLKGSRNLELAKKFVEFYMSDEQYLLFLTASTPGHGLPVRTKWLNNKAYFENEQLKKYEDIVKASMKAAYRYGIDFHLEHKNVTNPYMGQAFSDPEFSRQLSEFMAGNISAKNALTKVADGWRDTLGIK